MANLEGSVLNVFVGAAVGPNPTPLGEFLRIARVIKLASDSDCYNGRTRRVVLICNQPHRARR